MAVPGSVDPSPPPGGGGSGGTTPTGGGTTPTGGGTTPTGGTTPPPDATTPGGTDTSLEAQLLAALSQGGTGGSVGQQQNPVLVGQSSGTPGILYVGLAAAVGLIIFLLVRKPKV